MAPRALLLACCLAFAAARKPAQCKMHEDYPPTAKTLPSGENKTVEWFVLDLDAPAQERWTGLVKPRTEGIQNLVDVVVDVLKDILGAKKVESMLTILDFTVGSNMKAWPNDYAEEVAGIARATGIHKSELFLLQMAYEVWGLCTSMVVQDADGEIWHGRNLDFGLFPAFNFTDMNWRLTDALRPLVANVDVRRAGKTLYYSTTYAGFTGVITGMRPHAFSVSVDSRFDNKFDIGLVKWILGDHTHHELTFTVRQALESPAISNYSDAFRFLNDSVLIGPSYIILGGKARGEGAVISKESATIDVMDLGSALRNGSFYVLETNYDHWKEAPFFDDRRNPAKACLDQLGPGNVKGFEGVFNVLNGKPNLNKLTTYTTLMSVKTGQYEAYRQYCEGLCSFW